MLPIQVYASLCASLIKEYRLLNCNEFAMTSDGTDEERNPDAEDLKSKFNAVLAGINEKSNGTFATSKVLPRCPTPGLMVHGLGNIGLPLSERMLSNYRKLVIKLLSAREVRRSSILMLERPGNLMQANLYSVIQHGIRTFKRFSTRSLKSWGFLAVGKTSGQIYINCFSTKKAHFLLSIKSEK